MGLDLKILKSILHYDFITGDFINLINRSSSSRKNDIAGSLEKIGYIRIMIAGKKYYAHRLAYFYVNGLWPECIDHINGIRTDNRIDNLRNVTKGENARNRRTPEISKSGFTGVSWCKNSKKWRAKISSKGKTLSLGYYDEIDDAKKARKDADIKYGFHENHGDRKRDHTPSIK